MRAISLGTLLLLLGTASEAVAATKPIAPEQAIALAFAIGGVKAFADKCHAPRSSYQSVLDESLTLLPSVYRRADFDSSQSTLDEDIAKGADSFRANANMDCSHFRRVVSNLLIRTRNLEGRTPPKHLAPYDKPGWPDSDER
jgi:hypothetical protein